MFFLMNAKIVLFGSRLNNRDCIFLGLVRYDPNFVSASVDGTVEIVLALRV